MMVTVGRRGDQSTGMASARTPRCACGIGNLIAGEQRAYSDAYLNIIVAVARFGRGGGDNY